MVAVNGFIVMSPEDGSTPMGTKTWYYDSEFTGRHTSFIMQELPSTLKSILFTHARGQGIFGFSQGGVGAIMFTMGRGEYSSIAAFNGGTMPGDCFYNNECHQECGVDFVMCEILWTTISVAFFPYIVVKHGFPVHTTGAYDPMAQGVCTEMTERQVPFADCMYLKGEGSDTFHLQAWAYTYKGPDDGPLLARFHCNSNSNNQMVWNCQVLGVDWIEDGSIASYFYMNPKFFVMSVQHFIPTHNIMTDAPYAAQCELFMQRVPLFKLWMNPSIMVSINEQAVIQNVLISCDQNDQFGLHRVTQTYISLLSSNLIAGFGGYWIYDLPGSVDGVLTSSTHDNGFLGNGHFYDFHDVKLTAQWFSDTFRTWGAPPTGGFPKEFDRVAQGTAVSAVKFDEFGLSTTWAMTPTRDAQLCFAFNLNRGGSSKSATGGMIAVPGEGGDTSRCFQFYHTPSAIAMSSGSAIPGLIEDALRFGAIHADLDEFASNANQHEMNVHECWVGDTGPTIGGNVLMSFKKAVSQCSLFCGTTPGTCSSQGYETGKLNGMLANNVCSWYPTYYTKQGGGQLTFDAATQMQRLGVFNYCASSYAADADM